MWKFILILHISTTARPNRSPAEAQAITQRLPVTVRISGPTINWQSHPGQKLPDWMRIDQFLKFLKPMYPAWDDALTAKLVKLFALPMGQRLDRLSQAMGSNFERFEGLPRNDARFDEAVRAMRTASAK